MAATAVTASVRPRHCSERGFSLIEMIVVLAVAAVLTGMVALNLHRLGNPADSAANSLAGYFKRTRALALNSTRAYTIMPSSDSTVMATYGSTCSSDPQTDDSKLVLQLPKGARFTTLAWSVCFGTRGLTDSSIDVEIQDETGSKTVQVALGGGTRIL